MTLAELITYYRDRIRDVDTFAYVQTDQEVAAQLSTSVRQLAAKRLTVLADVVISATSTPTMNTTLTDEYGFLVGTHAAWRYLRDEFSNKLRTGQFGVVWRSGMEEENSLQASQAYHKLVAGLELEWQDWVLTINRDVSMTRIQ